MNFNATTIVPGGRYKYGEYLASGNLTSKVTSTIYGGNNTTSDIGSGTSGGGGNTGGSNDDTTGGTENLSWQLYLSKDSAAFDGPTVALSPQSDVTSLVGLLGTQLIETYVGDITGQHTYDSTTGTFDPALPANYGITGIPESGMVVVVTNNGNTGTTLTITVDNTITQNTGTLQIPCAVSLNQMQDLEDIVVDWEAAYQAGKAMPLILEYSWSISSNNGGSTADAYRLDLTNENASINCDADGNIPSSSTKPTCVGKLWYGMEAVTGATYGVTYPASQNVQGLGYTIANNQITLNFADNFNFSGTPLEITVTATINGTTWRKVMTISKAYPGKDGSPATSYWLVLSHNEAKYNPNTIEVTPTAITASAMMQVGSDAPTAATGTTIYYGFDTDDPSTVYTGPVSVDVTHDYMSFALYKGNTIVDGVETVPILSDGMNGTNGSSGESVYRLDLSNQNASINCDSDGNILRSAVRPTCKAKLYYGSELVTSATYSIVSASCSYTGLTLTYGTTGATLNFNEGNISTPLRRPFDFDPAYSSIEITVEARINNVLHGSAVMTVSRSIAGKDGQSGTNGRGITGVTEWYALNNNESSAPTSGWSTGITNPTSASPFLWNYEEIGYTTGNTTTTDPVIIARYTKDGKGISSITEYYQTNNSTVLAPTTWSTSMVVPTNDKPYLWNYEKTVFTDGSSSSTSPVIIGIKGDGGANGRGITGVTEWYAVNNNESTAPTSGWSTAITQTSSGNPYLWNYEEIGYTSGNTTTTDPVIISRYTKDGKGISAVTEYYQTNNSTVTPPSTWSTTMVVPTTASPYLWNYEKITYTDGSTGATDPVIIGIRGEDGQPGRSITGVTEYYQINNNESTAPTNWSTAIMSPTSSKPFLWNYEAINYDSGNPTTTDPVIIARYTKDGKGVSALTEYYAISNSTSSTQTFNWQTTLQIPTDDYPYLWNYELVTYTDGSTASTNPAIIGIKGSNGTNGDDAISYWLTFDADEVVLNPNTSAVTPSSITISAMMQVGQNTPTAATGCTIYYCWGTGDPYRNGYIYTAPITISTYQAMQYRCINVALYKDGKIVDGVETIPILKDGTDGEAGGQGRQGAAIRGPVNWYTAMEDTGRRWSNGSGSTESDKDWIDIIVKDNVYYRCVRSYTEQGWAWSSVTDNWVSADTEFGFVATDLLLANNAKINFLTGQEIYMLNTTDPNNPVITAGIAGGTGHTATTVNFWAGSSQPSNAPFQVHSDGSIKATSGTFAGYVQMPYYFISDLTVDVCLTSSTVGTVWLSQTKFQGYKQTAPTNPVSGWTYYNMQTNKYQYYKTSWVTMTTVSTRGYTCWDATGNTHAYLIADGCCGSYGMGDGGMLVFPEPSAALNGYTYHIVVVPNIATRAQGQNPGISIMTASGTTSFLIYCYTTSLSSCARLSFYGGHVEITCVPIHNQNCQTGGYIWAVTQCTGGVDCYSGTTSTSFMESYSTVAGYSTEDAYQTITKIKADSTLPSSKQRDTLYITRD